MPWDEQGSTFAQAQLVACYIPHTILSSNINRGIHAIARIQASTTGRPMSDIKLFSMRDGAAIELPGSEVALERSLQELIEQNLETLLGVRFLASEYSTGPKHGGRIDSLGLDENGSPVILEYKRSTNENVINQGLYYLDWLMDHRAEFQLLVMKRLGAEVAEAIDWSAPRLICIAGNFTKYDEYAVQQMGRNIELIRYKRFGEELLMFELAHASTAPASHASSGPVAPSTSGSNGPRTYKEVAEQIEDLSDETRDVFDALHDFLVGLGDDVQRKVLKFYLAYRRIRNFACVEVQSASGTLKVYVKVDPKSVQIEEGFTRDVSEIGTFGTGDLEITIRSRDDLNRAFPLLQKSYEVS